MVPEPTEAMVEAAMAATVTGPQGTEFQIVGREDEAVEVLKAAIAAAPPEWLLRAALTEDEIIALQFWSEDGAILHGDADAASAIPKLKAARALRGGEETNG